MLVPDVLVERSSQSMNGAHNTVVHARIAGMVAMQVCAVHLEDQAPPELSSRHLQRQDCDRSNWQMQTQRPASCSSTWLQHPYQGISAPLTGATHKRQAALLFYLEQQ